MGQAWKWHRSLLPSFHCHMDTPKREGGWEMWLAVCARLHPRRQHLRSTHLSPSPGRCP